MYFYFSVLSLFIKKKIYIYIYIIYYIEKSNEQKKKVPVFFGRFNQFKQQQQKNSRIEKIGCLASRQMIKKKKKKRKMVWWMAFDDWNYFNILKKERNKKEKISDFILV